MSKISTLIGFCPFCKRAVKESECSETKRGFVHNCTKTDNKIISTRIDHYNTLRNLKLLAESRIHDIDKSLHNIPQDYGHSFGNLQFAMFSVSENVKNIKNDLKKLENYLEEMNKTNETLPREYLHADITQLEIRIVRILRKFMGKEYSNHYTVLRGPQDEDFCETCKKVFNADEYNIYSDISECCHCLDCFFRGLWKYVRLSRKDRHFINELSKRW